jgi:Fe-S-cluster containining protein
MQERKRFYDDGVRFECQGDGKCCLNHGRHTYVYVSFSDRKRLAAHLGMTTLEFTKRYTQASDGMVHLKDPDRDCPFFKDHRCGVHSARPWQCRTWPFWKENMHPKVWERDVAAFCPGVGKGRLYTAEEIEQIMAKRSDVAGCPSQEEMRDT